MTAHHAEERRVPSRIAAEVKNRQTSQAPPSCHHSRSALFQPPLSIPSTPSHSFARPPTIVWCFSVRSTNKQRAHARGERGVLRLGSRGAADAVRCAVPKQERRSRHDREEGTIRRVPSLRYSVPCCGFERPLPPASSVNRHDLTPPKRAGRGLSSTRGRGGVLRRHRDETPNRETRGFKVSSLSSPLPPGLRLFLLD